MPKHIYAAAFANEFIEDKTALLNALRNICDTFEPMMYSGDESPVVIDSLLEDELSFNSAQVILDKTVHDDGETYFLLFSSNPSYAGMFLGSLDFLKKQKGLDKKYFAYFVDISDIPIEEFSYSFRTLFSFVASSYSLALQAAEPDRLDVLLTTFTDTTSSGKVEYQETYESGGDVFADIVRLHFDMNFKDCTVFVENPEARNDFIVFLNDKITELKQAMKQLVLQGKLDRGFFVFLSIELQALEQSLIFFGGFDEDEEDYSADASCPPSDSEDDDYLARDTEDYCENSRRCYFESDDYASNSRTGYDDEEYSVKSRMCDDEEEEAPTASLSEVQFSAISQKKMTKGDYTMIDVLMYEECYRWVVDKALEEAGREGAVNETRSGFFEVMANTTVKIVLTSRDAEIIEGEDEKEWFGKHQRFSFVASIPEDYAKKKLLFTAYVYFNGALATKLNILADCVDGSFGEIEVERNDIKTAFISYASQDRNTVSMIVQGLKMARPDLNVFFDVESLRCGERWEDQLKTRIDTCDVLYLCWSRNAKASKWVDFEWRYAYERKGVECIEPIPLEEPSLCEPPSELSEKHFNDLMLYIRK